MNSASSKSEKILTNPVAVVLLAITTCFLWGSAIPCIKVGYRVFAIPGNDVFSKLLFAGTRFFMAGVLLFGVCLFSRISLRLSKKMLGQLLLFGFFQTFLFYVLFYISLGNISGTVGSILDSSSIFMSILVAGFFYKEDKITPLRLLGLIVGFSGIVFLNLNGGGFGGISLTGEGFMFMAALIMAFTNVYTKKLTKQINPVAMTAYQLFFGSLLLMGVGFAGSGGKMLTFTGAGVGLLAYMAFISAAAYSIWSALLKYNVVGRVSIYRFLNPLFGVVLAYLLLKESMDLFRVAVSCVLVSAGIVLLNLQGGKKGAALPPAGTPPLDKAKARR
ncbi:MAG: DMT family transporter [Oscillospiraceae bacterium]